MLKEKVEDNCMNKFRLHRGCKFSAFTLAEMMVVLLIMTIILAVMAPVMTQRARSGNSTSQNNNSPWIWSTGSTTDAYLASTPPGSARAAIGVGQSGFEGEEGSRQARLILNSTDTVKDHILFKAQTSSGDSAETGRLYLNKGSISLGYKAELDDSNGSAIAIGNAAKAKSQFSIAIGQLAETLPISLGGTGEFSIRQVAIGTLSKAHGLDTVAIGPAAQAKGDFGVAMGLGAHGDTYGTIAIGAGACGKPESTSADSERNICIGKESKLYDLHTHNAVIIGQEYLKKVGPTTTSIATVANNYAIALGSSASAGGEYSVALGFNANVTNGINGDKGVAIGNESHARKLSVAIGSGAKITDNAGNSNSVAIGVGSEVSKAQSVAIGAGAKALAENSIAIGFGTEVGTSEDHTIKIGASNAYHVVIPGDLTVNGAAVPSDARLKYIGSENKSGLEKIKQLKVFNYTFKNDKEKTPRVGVIAQDLQKVFPDAVKKGVDGFFTIRMEDMFYAVVNAIKELDNKVSELMKQMQSDREVLKKLQNDNEQLKKENAELKARLDKIEAKLK